MLFVSYLFAKQALGYIIIHSHKMHYMIGRKDRKGGKDRKGKRKGREGRKYRKGGEGG